MKTINGQLFKKMLISAANNLYNHYPEIDALNVFPVPDGDTGMNMNLTLSSGSKEIANRSDDNVYELAKVFSRGLIIGSRGNSGVITSQIFKGFASGIEGKTNLTALDFAEGLIRGKEMSYKTVSRPVEGTILTVIREASDNLMDQVSSSWSIEKMFEVLLKEARKSLDHTPELLPVLKEVGVVDSGAAGLVKIFEGMQFAVLGKMIEKGEPSLANTPKDTKEGENTSDYDISFTLLIGKGANKKEFNDKRFTSFLRIKSSNLTVETTADTCNVKISYANPGAILNYAFSYGELVNVKVSNKNFSDFEEEIEKDDIDDTPLKEYGLIAVSSGKGLDEMFKQLGVDYIVSGGQTMNPSTEDFVEAIKKVHAKEVFIFPNNSNIVMAANQACEVIEDDVCARVVPSKTIPHGIVAAMAFNSEVDANANFNEMKAALKNIKSGSVTYAIKDTDIDGVHVTKGDYMGILDKTILMCEKSKTEALYGTIEQMVDDNSYIITVIIGEDVSEEEVNEINKILNDKYPDFEIDIKVGNQPVYCFLIGVE